jgi:YqaJ-like recombinase protein
VSVTFHEVEQRSLEWSALRLGRLTASRAADMLATIKTGEAAARRNLRVQLMLERITGRSHERTVRTEAMQDGIDREADAVAKYEELSGALVYPIGFISSDDYMAGCSPDGLIGDYGLVSIKCPTPAIHLEYLRSGKVPADYLAQIHHEFWISGRLWADFFSFQPDFPEPLQTKLVRVLRVDADVKDYERKALAFLAEVDIEEQSVRTMANLVATLKAS